MRVLEMIQIFSRLNPQAEVHVEDSTGRAPATVVVVGAGETRVSISNRPYEDPRTNRTKRGVVGDLVSA